MSHDVLSEEARSQLERWSNRSRRLFTELLEDAGTDLQRELLQRAVAAGHTPAEVHAFADELRALDDDDAFEACTLDARAQKDYTVAQLLRAEADPLFAYELRGGQLSPSEDDDVPAPAPTPPAPDEEDLHAPAHDALAMALAKKQKKGFEADSPGVRPRRMDWNDLGGSAPPPATAKPTTGSAPAHVPAQRYVEELATEATRALGITWREVEVDVAGGQPLEEVLPQAAAALSRGIPIPCAVGNAPGASRRLILVLQLNAGEKSRAWQLHDPFTQATYWAHEGDLLARNELPFADKALRRITRILLPTSRGSTF